MKIRIGLFTPKKTLTKKKGESTVATYVEVADLAELSAQLTKHGAKKAGLFWRDRLGEGHLEGKMFPASDLKAEHFTWLGAKAEASQTRGLFYET